MPPGLLGPGQVAADLVYAPRPTRWLTEAAATGATVLDGLGMLVHQAAAQLVLWTGVQPPVEAMWRAAEAASPPSRLSRPGDRRVRTTGGAASAGHSPALANASSVASRSARVSASRWEGTVSRVTRMVMVDEPASRRPTSAGGSVQCAANAGSGRHAVRRVGDDAPHRLEVGGGGTGQ